MDGNSGYLLEPLRQGEDLTLFRGHAAGKPPVLAVATTGHRSVANEAKRLKNELKLASELDSEWAVRPLGLTRHDGRDLLILEDNGGLPLDLYLAKKGDDVGLAKLLQIASNLASSIGLMHRVGLVHKDIKPTNILVGHDGRVRLMGFGIASKVRSERPTPGPPEIIAGTFAYMAPEQTGRMNRSVDTRSDLYSFGVTLYELFTGELPFSARNPMEWVHCHIARQPVPPIELMPSLPLAINAIILKLLAKNPEDRYQTAKGVQSDILKYLDLADQPVELASFHPGLHDVSDRLIIPERLYGRDAEIGVLLSAAERTLSDGSTEMVVISGYSGIGKSSMVAELHKILLPSCAMFGSGKFDQYKRDIPYATIAQAFQGLVRQILGKSDDVIASWRTALLAALGPNAQLMVNLIPELSLIVGDQAPSPEVDSQSAQSRFQRVFCSMLGVFANAEHPLILFVDDLQWLDAGTLELLQIVVSDPDIRNLMVIGAYRDNEVGSDHPLHKTLAAVRQSPNCITEISLGPLDPQYMGQLCADALNTNLNRTQLLAELVFEKTAGNPFFAKQFIAELSDEQMITFHPESSTWFWDISRIKTKDVTDNIADLMTAKMSRLSADTQVAMGQLACLGSAVDVITLSIVMACSVEEVELRLLPAVEAGMVTRSNDGFSFVHDRMQEASYALISVSRRPAEHLSIGRILLRQSSHVEHDEKIFETANQFNRGSSAIETFDERELVANLNLTAGKRAKSSGAYASALAYFVAGRDLLGESAWIDRYELTLKFELERVECEIASGDLSAAEERLSLLSGQVVDITDQANVVCLSVLLYFTTGRNERAVEVGLQYLSKVGISWAIRPTEQEVRQEYLEMRLKLTRAPIEGLIDWPVMTDPRYLSIMAVLTELFPAAYAVDRYLLELVLLRMTNISLEHGNCESSSVAYSALNMALGSHFDDYKTAFGLGQLACQLVERHGASRYKARVYSCFAAFTMPWMKHVQLCRPLMKQAFQIGSSMGDMAFAAYNSRNLMTHLLFSGVPLAKVQREVEQTLDFARNIQLGMAPEKFIGQLDLVRKLRGLVGQPSTPDDGWATQSVEGNPGLAMMVCYHWVFRLQERYFATDYEGAIEAARQVEEIRWAMRSSIELADYDFYAALSFAAASEQAHGETKSTYLRNVSRHYERVSVWAENCPENFGNRKALIGAELARLEGRFIEAQVLYEEAVRSARRFGFLQNEALANELAGHCYVALTLGTVAETYLQNARDCYERWGGVSKVKQINLRHPHLRHKVTSLHSASTIDTPVAQLDVEAVDKASQTLSSEMMLPRLLEKLMHLAVEHAGAERGSLTLLQDDVPCIEAKAITGKGRVDVFVGRSAVTVFDLPLTALNYVLRTGERLILDDAGVEGLDFDDPYVRSNQPRSVLCLPIYKDARVIGALYLENNLTSRAFTHDKVAVLEFLASQAAIWLENARLYSDLRRSEGWLREAQQLSSTGSFYWQVDTDAVDFSEQMYRIYELDPNLPVTVQTIATRIHEEDLPLMEEMIEIARGPATELDYLYRAKMPDLSIKYLHLVAQGTRDKEGKLVYTGAIQDVTPRYTAEEALGKARSELAHVTRITTLGVLTASIAHEVNQPLLGIVVNASTCLRMLASDPPNIEGARKTAERSIRDGHRAADVIRRLRALFGKKGTTTEPVDLNDAAREVIALSSSELQRSKVSLQSDLAANLPFVMGDRVQLQQVILNLLLNAADAMAKVDDRPRKLTIKTELGDEASVRLIVQDVGVGIPKDFQEKLFEAFYTTKDQGMGMGLSVSRFIIESHSGRLWANSNDGPGATFSFSIPRADDGSISSQDTGSSQAADIQSDHKAFP